MKRACVMICLGVLGCGAPDASGSLDGGAGGDSSMQQAPADLLGVAPGADLSTPPQQAGGHYLGSPLCLTGDSKVIDRASARLAERDGLQHPTAPGSGNVTSSSGANGLTHWQYSDSSVTE